MQAILTRTPAGDHAARNADASLPRKHRILLMAIDGKTPRRVYLNSLRSFGDIRGIMDELETLGLIACHYPAGSSRDEPETYSGDIVIAPPVTRQDTAALARQVSMQAVNRNVEKLQQTLNLMSDFVTEHFPELAFDILFELEKLDTLDALLAVLPDYQLAISQQPDAAAQHVHQLNSILTR